MAGMKFFAEEVEEVLDAHPAVRASRVFAREHAHLGEIPVAEVVAADPARPPDLRALTAFCRERLPAYKIPRESPRGRRDRPHVERKAAPQRRSRRLSAGAAAQSGARRRGSQRPTRRQ